VGVVVGQFDGVRGRGRDRRARPHGDAGVLQGGTQGGLEVLGERGGDGVELFEQADGHRRACRLVPVCIDVVRGNDGGVLLAGERGEFPGDLDAGEARATDDEPDLVLVAGVVEGVEDGSADAFGVRHGLQGDGVLAEAVDVVERGRRAQADRAGVVLDGVAALQCDAVGGGVDVRDRAFADLGARDEVRERDGDVVGERRPADDAMHLVLDQVLAGVVDEHQFHVVVQALLERSDERHARVPATEDDHSHTAG
jgi:hypothetical protein